MAATTRSLRELTAEDLMTREVVRLPEAMPLRDAARLLLRNHVGGAPVVNAAGRCVGVLSAIDFLRQAGRCGDITRPATGRLPITCSFQAKHRTENGNEVTLCTLPPDVCPIQRKHTGEPGEELLVCSQPRCVLMDWQIVDVEKLPEDEVREYMTADPVTVGPNTAIRTLARRMIDAHIHQIIVVDEEQWPVGIVSSTDLLAVLAYLDDEP
jgi:CBS-domain-containing membrane protein